MDRAYSGPKLPRILLDRFDGPFTHSTRPVFLLSAQANASKGGGTSGSTSARKQHRGRKSIPLSRRDKRRNDRKQKKTSHNQDSSQGRRRWEPVAEEVPTSSEDELPVPNAKSRRKDAKAAEKSDGLKSILKTSKESTTQAPTNEEKHPPRQVSVKTKERLDADDAEITNLEKKLGIKSKKLPKAFQDDGLFNLLEGLENGSSDEGGSHKKRKGTEDEKWLANKRKRRRTGVPEPQDEYDDADHSEGGSVQSADSEDSNVASTDEEPQPEEDSHTDVESDDGEFDGFDSEEHSNPPPKRVKENPYVAPNVDHGRMSVKYVPPSRRAPPSNDEELNQRLRRQTQGLLNRLSDSNILSILSDVEGLFQTNPRQYVTATLVDLLLTLICNHAALNDTFIILHAGFISAVYKVIGPDFGAQMLEGIVQKIDSFYLESKNTTESGKEVVNLISLLAQLFNFQVISSDIVFDYVRLFLSSLTEIHTELLLRIVRTSGSQLRQDDPSSLKDIVMLLQKTVAATTEGKVSVRTQFMIETINDLKNNRLKTGVAGSAVSAEHSSRMKKILGTLTSRGSIKASEPLRVPLDDVRNADKKGKWWLVGASWKGTDTSPSALTSHAHPPTAQESLDPDSDGDPITGASGGDLLSLAHQNGMNNPLRRSIFSALVTASDCRDAHTRLLKLHLSRAQEREIPRVLLHCAAAEKTHNPYYTLVARRLCAADRKTRVAFQFALWDFLKRLGGGPGDDADDDDNNADDEGGAGAVPLRSVVNHAKLYGSLIATGALSVGVLKTMDPAALALPMAAAGSRRGRGDGPAVAGGGKAATFLEVLLIAVFVGAPPGGRARGAAVGNVDGLDDGSKTEGPRTPTGLEAVFRPALGIPGLAAGLRAFIERVVRRSDLVSGGKERRKVAAGCEVVSELLADEGEAAMLNEDDDSDGHHDIGVDLEEDY